MAKGDKKADKADKKADKKAKADKKKDKKKDKVPTAASSLPLPWPGWPPSPNPSLRAPLSLPANPPRCRRTNAEEQV